MKSVRIRPSCLCSILTLSMLFPDTVWSQFGPAPKQETGTRQNAAPVAVEDAPASAERPTIPATEATPPSLLIQIPDEPKGIDPASLLPPAMAAKVSVKFERQPLRDVVKWLQQELKINVLVNYRELSEAGVLVGEPITDHSDDESLYLLLNRFLGNLTLDWYFEDETLHISTSEDVSDHKMTVPYTLGDLFDNGFKAQAILTAR